MNDPMTPLTPDQLTAALYMLSANIESVPGMLMNEAVRAILKPQAYSYLQGVLQRFVQETKEDSDVPLDLTEDRLKTLAVALVHVGIALGRYYERTSAEPRISKNLSIDQLYSMYQNREER